TTNHATNDRRDGQVALRPEPPGSEASSTSRVATLDNACVVRRWSASVAVGLMALAGCGGTTHRASTPAPEPAPVDENCEGSNRALFFGGGHSACVVVRNTGQMLREESRFQAKWCPRRRCRVRIDLSQTFETPGAR